jgi:putative polyketide hydroxylase
MIILGIKPMESDIIVVGGGPCGHLSALLLGRLGIKTILLEKHPQVLNHPKAMGITARTAEIMRQIGLLENMLDSCMSEHPDAVSQWIKGGLNGELLGQTRPVSDINPYSPCTSFHCPQPHIEKVLREAVALCPSVTSLYGAKVTDLSQDAESVTATFEINGVTQSVTGQYLVAADGDQSFVRNHLEIERYGPGEIGRFLSVYFKANFAEHIKGRLAYLSNILGDDWFEVFVAVNGTDHWLMQHYLNEGEFADQYDPQIMQAIIRKTAGLPNLDVEVISISPWVMSPAIAKQWRHGRVFLVGDAAARVSPSGGLGMNNGLQSAHNLAWKLSQVIHGSATHTILDSYQAERLPAARFTFENSTDNANEIFDIVTAAFSGDWDKAQDLISQSRRAGAGYGQDFGITYESNALLPDGSAATAPTDKINAYIEQARPGHRAPLFALQTAGQKLNSIDLAGYRFIAWLGCDAKPDLFGNICPTATVLIENQDFEPDRKDWKSVFGISNHGGVLVRPDGYVYARVP